MTKQPPPATHQHRPADGRCICGLFLCLPVTCHSQFLWLSAARYTGCTAPTSDGGSASNIPPAMVMVTKGAALSARLKGGHHMSRKRDQPATHTQYVFILTAAQCEMKLPSSFAQPWRKAFRPFSHRSPHRLPRPNRTHEGTRSMRRPVPCAIPPGPPTNQHC